MHVCPFFTKGPGWSNNSARFTIGIYPPPTNTHPPNGQYSPYRFFHGMMRVLYFWKALGIRMLVIVFWGVIGEIVRLVGLGAYAYCRWEPTSIGQAVTTWVSAPREQLSNNFGLRDLCNVLRFLQQNATSWGFCNKMQYFKFFVRKKHWKICKCCPLSLFIVR